MSRHWVCVVLVAGAAMACGLAAAHQEQSDQTGHDEAASMMLDCEHLPAKALGTLPQPVAAWTSVGCRYTGQLLVESRGWQWRYPASFTTPVIVPATMASPHAEGARYFTSVTVATSESAAAAQLHQELVREVAVYADNAGPGVPAFAYTVTASNDLGDQLQIHFLPRAGGDLLGVVCTPKCTPENTFIVQKRGGDMKPRLQLDAALPEDAQRATLVGRAWMPGSPSGPSPVAVLDGEVFDASTLAATSSELLNARNPLALLREARQTMRRIGDVTELLGNSEHDRRDPAKPYLLTPVDLQAVRACGVTFIASMLERVIEEQAHGDPAQAEAVRRSIGEEIGTHLTSIQPGSPQAMRLKESLIKRGVWSQYLEVGIGPDAEVFNKAQPMSAVGTGAQIGILANSSWNNPEPEVVLAINRAGRVIGATLGNDVNLRDWEGRSALLLGRAKDNNASCAIGPWIRLLDEHFNVDALRQVRVEIEVHGEDGFAASGSYSLAQISRDPLDLAAQAVNRNHQYPDGLVLFLGTAFAPTQDRGEPGRGFTHKVGDVVTIRSRALGALSNRIDYCDQIAPWTYGAADLMRNLAARGLI